MRSTSNHQHAKHDRIKHAAAVGALLIAAGAVYGYHLGRYALGASEAYSALAAMEPGVVGVAHSALRADPGKPLLYHLLLHWFVRWFGCGETALRALSVCFGVASVGLVFGLAAQSFGFAVGLAAAALWAFNPLAVIFARWARMYSMFIALALGHLLAMARLECRPRTATMLIAGIAGAAMVYTHLGGVLILAADVLVIVRELRRTGRSKTWPAVVLAAVLFLPALPMTVEQSRALLFGHWLDWLGVRHGLRTEALVLVPMAAALTMWLTFGCRRADARREALQRYLIYAAAPMVALIAGSAVLRPMFEVRYVAPSMAMLAVVGAYYLDCGGIRIRNLGTTGAVALSLLLLPLCYRSQQAPWRAIARLIAAESGPAEPVFFESGFFSPDALLGREHGRGFPRGFFRVPFDYYFHGPNPREVVPGSDPIRARKLIAEQVKSNGGAWLISGEEGAEASAELPHDADMRVDYSVTFPRILVFHVRREIDPTPAPRPKRSLPDRIQR